MGKEVVMTQEGYDELKKKYEYLIKVRKVEVAEHLKFARELGDLSENAEYDAAKDEEAALHGEIREIEAQLQNAIIIEGKNKRNTVGLGSRVKIYDIKWDEELDYVIVGEVEADIHNNKISNESALAKAILGHKKGEICDVTAPNGDVFQVQIKDVK